jgi:hypothetical protein
MRHKIMIVAAVLLALCTFQHAGPVGAQTPTPGATGPVSPTVTVSDTATIPASWLPYTDSGSAFTLWYSPDWTPAEKQAPGSSAFHVGETKSIMLAVFPRAGRDLDALLRELLSTEDQAKGAGLVEEVVASGAWLHRVLGKFGRVSLMNHSGDFGERLIVLGSLNDQTFVLGLMGNLPGKVDAQDEADMAQLLDSIRLLGPGSDATPVAPPALSSR